MVDWHELLDAGLLARATWGPMRGRVAAAVQALCVRCPDRSFTFSRLVAGGSRDAGHRAPGDASCGASSRARSPTSASGPLADRDPLAVFAGRHIPEKRVLALPAALAAARRARARPSLRSSSATGHRPSRCGRAVAAAGLDDAIDVRGRVEADEVARGAGAGGAARAPSEREGYGLVVVEAIALGHARGAWSPGPRTPPPS